MIEADKMLHLRKYVLAVLRSDTKLCLTRSLPSTSLSARGGGYVLRSLHHCYVSPTKSRSHHVACGVRTFSTTVAQSSVDDVNQKLTTFCEDVKQGQTWSADRLKEVIQLCDESNHQLQPDISLLLLKCCGNLQSAVKSNEKQDFVDRIWRLAGRNNDTLTLEHYNTLLGVHAENTSSVDPKEFLADMIVKPDDDTYRLLFDTAVRTGNTKHLQSIMSMIKTKNISLSEEALCSLMRTYMSKGNVTEALDLFQFALDLKLPVGKLYTELACGYAAQGDISSLVKILNDQPKGTLSLVKIMKSLSVSGNGRHLPVVANFLKDIDSVVKAEMNNLIVELVRADRAVDVNTIINCIALNEEITTHTKDFISYFLNQLVMANAPVEDITRFASSFVETERDPMALINIAETSLKLGREKLSLAIFAAMRERGFEIRPHYYWPLLISAQRNEGEAKIFSLIESMRAMDVDIDFETLTSYVLPYVNTANPITMFQRLRLSGLSYNILGTPVIYFLLSKHRLNDVMYLYKHIHFKLDYRILMGQMVSTYFATRDINTYVEMLTRFRSGVDYVSLFLNRLLRNKSNFHGEELQLILKTFEKNRVRFSVRDADILKNRIVNITSNSSKTNRELFTIIERMVNKDFQFSVITTIPHPRYMTTSELACHLVELRSQEHGTKTILHRLLEAYYMENNLKKAEEIKEEYDKNQYQWTPGMKMQLFDLYVRHGKLQEAEKLLLDIQNLHNDSFLIDSNKIVLFATALVEADKPKMAFNVVESFSNINNKKDMNRVCYKLLNALARSSYHEYTKDMLNLLIQKKYCSITTELLRPLVSIPLQQNNILLAIEMLTKCMQMYKKLPFALEVLTALLREKDNPRSNLQNVDNHIEELYNLIENFKGVEVANTMVVIGLASMNKMEELGSILQNQRISMNTLINYFNFAQRSSNEMAILLRILEASQDSSNVNQYVLCETLLTFFSKTGDLKNATALWELMYTKDIEPSEIFKQGFIEFFRANKTPLPADFASSESKVNVSNQ